MSQVGGLLFQDSYTIFVGNPGTGKSTLLNAFFNKPQFKAGISFGSGMTTKLQLAKIGDHKFIGDTPGLSDVVLRKIAAAEIEKALKRNGDYRLVFIITLEAGRVRDSDAATVKLILESVDAEIPFGFVINKMSPEGYQILTNNLEAQKSVITSVVASIPNRSTSHFHCIKLLDSLFGKANAIAPPDVKAGLLKWLSTIPYARVREGQVKAINSETFDELKEATRIEIEKLLKDKAQMETRFQTALEQTRAEALKRQKELQAKTDAQIADIEKRRLAQQKKFEKDMADGKKREEAIQKSVKEANEETARVRASTKDLNEKLAQQEKALKLAQEKPQEIHHHHGGGGGDCVIL